MNKNSKKPVSAKKKKLTLSDLKKIKGGGIICKYVPRTRTFR